MTQQELLFDCLKASASAFACVEYNLERLKKAGFEELDYKEAWDLKKGGKYVMKHYGTTLYAFTIGDEYESCDAIRMAAAHTDYPCLRIKPKADFKTEGYTQVNLEVYGGPILNTWYDRPLGVAGRVIIRTKDAFAPKQVLYTSKKPLMIIPNLAIHMNREVNDGVKINKQVDLMPVVDITTGEELSQDYFLDYIAEELKVEKKDILDFELNTFLFEEPSYVGIADTMISAPHLDNHTSVVGCVSALIDSQAKKGIHLIALFDHEEIGNRSKQGAASFFTRDLLVRILRSLGCGEEEIDRSIYGGMLLSVDVAHGLHPNKKEKMDITNHPVLGKGFCIKSACSQSYATDAEAISVLMGICDEKQIPYQRFVNRSDVVGGGTLGGVASTILPMNTVDIGIPLLGMHSARELMAAADMDSLKDAITAYFNYL